MKRVFLKTNNKIGRQVMMFPYLGGSGTSLMKLAKELDKKSDYEIFVVFPPGHMGSNRKLYNNLHDLLEFYYIQIKEILKPGCIFFGHSMGGVIAYFLARKLCILDRELKPKYIILSAAPSPDFMLGRNLSDSDDTVLLKDMEELGGLPEDLLENRELLDYFIPIFRADYKILEDAAQVSPQLINIPVKFIWCYNDKIVQSEKLIGWRKYFNEISVFRTMPVDAGHMYLNTNAKLVADMIHDYIGEQE